MYAFLALPEFTDTKPFYLRMLQLKMVRCTGVVKIPEPPEFINPFMTVVLVHRRTSPS